MNISLDNWNKHQILCSFLLVLFWFLCFNVQKKNGKTTHFVGALKESCAGKQVTSTLEAFTAKGYCQELKESLNSSKISKTQTFIIFQLATNRAGAELQE
ncbi:hypothetical protein ACB092_12G017200 [Castanea dentata]